MTNEEKIKLRKELAKEDKLEISIEAIIQQVEIFERGIPFVKLERCCTTGDGIKILTEGVHVKLIKLFEQALGKGRVTKFVPASGAASRMFKSLLYALNEKKEVNGSHLKNGDTVSDVNKFLKNLSIFAFYDDLKAAINSAGKKIEDLLVQNDAAEILKYLLTPYGLNYANLPKGCIKFHKYPDGSRTAFEEHFVEALNYSTDANGIAKIHFTISPEHEQVVNNLFDKLVRKYEADGQKINVSVSFQSPSTNTVAVTADNKPFRDNGGKILFRPGGHGALLNNLDELRGDIVMIKNIDNVVSDHLKGETHRYKKILGGYLVELQSKIFSFLDALDNCKSDKSLIDEIHRFIISELEMVVKPRFSSMNDQEKRKYLFEFLNRPVRVCGMVKNAGEPGGGPFWVKVEPGNVSKQVVETTQIDLSSPEQKKIFKSATHFSPTDFVCGLRDYKGNNFNLFDFVNPSAGLITKKYFNGRQLKALELPGLWNGGMYYWLSVFVEVPDVTFNPVKEVNDLLKPEHQPVY